MACATCSFTPCQCGGSFTAPSSVNQQATLVASLVCAVDAARDLYSCLGVRTYEVALVRTRWSGGERGVGFEELVSEELILPTPKVSDLSDIATVQNSHGDEEEGALTVSEISLRYTEDQLLGRGSDGSQTPADQQFYWEVRGVNPDGTLVRRRFFPDSVPNRDGTAIGWTVTLTRSYQDRTRAGEVA